MPRPPKKMPDNLPMSETEMIEQELIRAENRLNVDMKPIMKITGTQVYNALSGKIEKISLDDLQKVKRKALSYMNACLECNTIPNHTGLCRALGHSRNSIYNHMSRNPDSEVTEYLQLCKDAFSEILDTAGLTNSANPIMCMFLLKVHHQYVDKSELFISTPAQESPLRAAKTDEEIELIKAKYLAPLD